MFDQVFPQVTRVGLVILAFHIPDIAATDVLNVPIDLTYCIQVLQVPNRRSCSASKVVFDCF